MTETVKKRRRWPWVVLSAILVLTAGAMAWHFRPLNTAEKALVGSWRPPGALSDTEYRFDADRRCFFGGNYYGRWSASKDTVFVGAPVPFKVLARAPWHFRLAMYFESLVTPHAISINWDGENRVFIGQRLYARVRDPGSEVPN